MEKLYHCFGCGAGGDVFKFVMETESRRLRRGAGAARRPLQRAARAHGGGSAAPRSGARGATGCSRCSSARPRTTCGCCGRATRRRRARAYLAVARARRGRRCGSSASATRRRRATAWWSGSRRAGFSDDELLAAGLAHAARGGGLVDRFLGAADVPAGRRARAACVGFGARALREGQQPKYLNSSEGEVFSQGPEGVRHPPRARRRGQGRVGRARRGLHGRRRAAPGRDPQRRRPRWGRR